MGGDRGIDLTINAGEVHAIMSPNASGKSTLAQVLAGREEYEVTSGEVLEDPERLAGRLRQPPFTTTCEGLVWVALQVFFLLGVSVFFGFVAMSVLGLPVTFMSINLAIMVLVIGTADLVHILGRVAALRRAEAAGQATGIMFGGERAGLHNDDVARAQAVVEVRVRW